MKKKRLDQKVLTGLGALSCGLSSPGGSVTACVFGVAVCHTDVGVLIPTARDQPEGPRTAEPARGQRVCRKPVSLRCPRRGPSGSGMPATSSDQRAAVPVRT